MNQRRMRRRKGKWTVNQRRMRRRKGKWTGSQLEGLDEGMESGQCDEGKNLEKRRGVNSETKERIWRREGG